MKTLFLNQTLLSDIVFNVEGKYIMTKKYIYLNADSIYYCLIYNFSMILFHCYMFFNNFIVKVHSTFKCYPILPFLCIINHALKLKGSECFLAKTQFKLSLSFHRWNLIELIVISSCLNISFKRTTSLRSQGSLEYPMWSHVSNVWWPFHGRSFKPGSSKLKNKKINESRINK